MTLSRAKAILKTSAALLVGLVFLFPILWMVYASLLPDEDVMREIASPGDLFTASISLQNYLDVFERMPFFNSVGVSFAFTLTVVAVGAIVNSACGYAFARLRFRGNRLLFACVAALIIIPFEALALPLFLIVGVRCSLMNTLPGLFLPYLAKAFNIFFMRQYFLSFPKELEEAARVEGASWFRIFFSIALPYAKPAIATCAILDFQMHWSEYLWPLIITNKPAFETVQVGLGHFYTLPPIQWGDIMAYSVMATIPMLIIFIVFQRFLVQSLATTGIK